MYRKIMDMRIVYLYILFGLFLSLNLYSEEAFWESVNAPAMGEIRDIELDSLGNIYIIAYNGLWVSTNQGNNWKQIYSHFMIDRGRPSYAIKSDGKIAIAIDRFIEKPKVIISTDFGKSWKNLNLSWNNIKDEIKEIKWHGNYLYVSTDYSFNDTVKIFYSNCIDSNWYQYGVPIYSGENRDISILNDSCIGILGGLYSYQSSQDIVFFTTNSGKTWNNIYFQSEYVNCINYFSQKEIFIGTRNGLKVLKNGTGLEAFGPENITVMSIYIPNRRDIYLGTYDFVYFSLDSGKSWIRSFKGMENLISSDYNTSCIFNIRRDSYGYLYSQTARWGLFRSTDSGESWHQSNNGFFGAKISGIAFDKNKNIYIGANELYKSSDNGISWVPIPGFDGNIVYCVFISRKNYLYIGKSLNYELYRSKDEGKTWDNIQVLFSPLHNIIENKKGYLFAVNRTGNIERSFDDGDTWDIVYLPGNGSNGINIAVNSEDHLFTPEYEWARLFRSTNDGNNWDTVYDYEGQGITDHPRPILFYTNKPIGYAHIAVPWEIFNQKTTDNGKSWLAFDSTGMKNEIFLYMPLAIDSLGNVYWQCIDGNNNNHLIVRTNSDGIIIDTVISGLAYPYLDKITVDPDGYLWGFQNYRGIYRSKQKYVSIKDNPILSDNLILQSSPNPFSESTSINYSLPSPSHVKLSIYDIFGREVAVIFEGWQDIGEHIYHLPFNIYHLSDGIYFCHLQAGGVTKVIKLIFIR